MADLVSLDEVRAAARRIRGVAVRTPLVPFPGAAAARDAAPPSPGKPGLLIKPESLQPTGAFKLRGAYNAISALPEDARAHGVVAHSSGNHGFAVAYAAALLNIPAAIVVPDNASSVKTEAIQAAGAELVYVEPTLTARLAESERIVRTRGYALIPPFDDRQVIAGQGTIGLEIAEDLANQAPRAVLVPVAGGGLVSGIAVAVKALMPEARVIGVEPELAADARESFLAGTRVAWPATDTARTRADALRAEQIGELPFAHIRELISDIVTVTEDEILRAIRRLALRARLVAEPGGAVAVAASLFRSAGELGLAADGGPVVAVLSGGNIDPALLAEVLAGNTPRPSPGMSPASRLPRAVPASPTIGSVMRTGLAYTSARVLLLVVSLVLLYGAGARGFLLLALAFAISALASYVLLSRQREAMAGALNRRLRRVTAKAAEFRERLEDGATAEDGAVADGAAGDRAAEGAADGGTAGQAVTRR